MTAHETPGRGVTEGSALGDTTIVGPPFDTGWLRAVSLAVQADLAAIYDHEFRYAVTTPGGAAQLDALLAAHTGPAAGGCVLWHGPTDDGRPMLTLHRGMRPMNVRRALWLRDNEPVHGLLVGRTCSEPRCVAEHHITCIIRDVPDITRLLAEVTA